MCAFARILLSTGVVQLPATILSALQRSRACEIILSPNPYPLLCRSLSHSHSSDVSSSIHSPFYILACFVGLMALLFCHLACLTLRRFLCVTDRFRRVPTALGLMTPREWRVQSSIGLLQKDNHWPPTSLGMPSLAMVLITTAPELSYVPRVSIGITWSEYFFMVRFVT